MMTYIAYVLQKKLVIKLVHIKVMEMHHGTFVYTGFKPTTFIMVKRMGAGTGYGLILEVKRPAYNLIITNYIPNSNAAENTGDKVDFLSNGFKMDH